MPSADWTAPTATGPVDARVVLPGSKSLTNRYLVLAALASDVSLLRSPLRSRDTLLMVQALRTLGAVVDDVDDGDWLVTPGRLVGIHAMTSLGFLTTRPELLHAMRRVPSARCQRPVRTRTASPSCSGQLTSWRPDYLDA